MSPLRGFGFMILEKWEFLWFFWVYLLFAKETGLLLRRWLLPGKIHPISTTANGQETSLPLIFKKTRNKSVPAGRHIARIKNKKLFSVP
jgi:hypothetical protein